MPLLEQSPTGGHVRELYEKWWIRVENTRRTGDVSSAIQIWRRETAEMRLMVPFIRSA